MVSPLQKRRAVQGVVKVGLCSQRRACRYLGLHRSSHRYPPKQPSEWLLRLHHQIEMLSRKYPRLGYRKLTRLLRREGWQAVRKLVQRIRRVCYLRVKRWMKRPRRRGRSTGTIPTRAERVNHVWSGDFISDRTDNGGKLRILSVLDEYSRECLALHVARQLTAADLIEVMENLATQRGIPGHIRRDNGSEFVARTLQAWLADRHVKTLYIEPGSPWQDGHAESFHGSLRDECLDREPMLSVAEARVVSEDYRQYYNEVRPHGGLRLPHTRPRLPRSPGSGCQACQRLTPRICSNPRNCYLYYLTQLLTRSGPNSGTRSGVKSSAVNFAVHQATLLRWPWHLVNPSQSGQGSPAKAGQSGLKSGSHRAVSPPAEGSVWAKYSPFIATSLLGMELVRLASF